MFLALSYFVCVHVFLTDNLTTVFIHFGYLVRYRVTHAKWKTILSLCFYFMFYLPDKIH